MKYDLNQLLELMEKKPVQIQQDNRRRKGYAVLRVSYSVQDEEAQRADIERACEQHNLEITRWHREREKANNVEARTSFLQFIEDAKHDTECEFIICRDPSRFFRDDQMIDRIEEDLAAYGVRLIDDYRYVTFQDELTPQEIWRKGISRLQGKAYSAEVRDWTMKSMSFICQQRHPDPQMNWCYHLGGLPLFGYKRVKVPVGYTDKRGNPIQRELWLLNDQTCEALGKQIWEIVYDMWLDWYCKRGWGEERIAQKLTEYGVKSARGKAVSISTVHDWRQPLSLLTYNGWYIWNKHSTHRLGRHVRQTPKPPHEWCWVKDAHPAIFTVAEMQEIEDCARLRSKKWKRRGVSPRAEAARSYALSGGLAKCGACGANIVGMSRRYRGEKVYGYYLCGTWNYRGGADCGDRFPVSIQALEEFLLTTAVKLFPVAPQRAEAWAKKVNSIIREKLGDNDTQRCVIERKIDEVESRINNLVDAITSKPDSVLIERLEAKAAALTKERTELEQQLKSLSQKQVPEIRAEDVLTVYNELQEAVKLEDATYRRRVISGVTESITFDPHTKQVKVRYHWGGVTNKLVAPRGVEPLLPA